MTRHMSKDERIETMENCVEDNLRDAIGGLADCRARMGKANDAMNSALGAINRLERENQALKDELEKLRAAAPEEKPQCLDADGVPIKVGDVVYRVNADDGEPIPDSEAFEVVVITDDSHFLAGRIGDDVCKRLAACYTHRMPDSWERFVDESELDPLDYCDDVLCLDTDPMTIDEMWDARKGDIIRRCKRLAGIWR